MTEAGKQRVGDTLRALHRDPAFAAAHRARSRARMAALNQDPEVTRRREWIKQGLPPATEEQKDLYRLARRKRCTRAEALSVAGLA